MCCTTLLLQWKEGLGTTNNTVTFTALYNISGLVLPGVDDYEKHLTDNYGNYTVQKVEGWWIDDDDEP